jgi:hypothetical protein
MNNRTRATRSRVLTKDGRKDLEKIPSMKEFLHRQKVIRQYRGFLRALDAINDDSFKHQGRDEVQRQFRALKHETDALTISMAVKEVSVLLLFANMHFSHSHK